MPALSDPDRSRVPTRDVAHRLVSTRSTSTATPSRRSPTGPSRTTVDGIPCTTALRTVIDIAADVDLPRLEEIVHDFLDRGLFTVDEAWRRLSQPDMANRAGAALLRRMLPEAG